MVQRRERAEFALEPPPGRAGERALHQLERDFAAVAGIAGAVDDAHAPLAELGADLEPLVPQLGDVSTRRGVLMVAGQPGRRRDV